MIIETRSAKETFELGFEIGSRAKAGEVYTMVGDLGVGKTVFTQDMAKGLEISEAISSPTFTIVQVYDAPKPLYHFDMYRINGWDDLYSTGYFDYLDIGACLVIEWSENIEDSLPEDTITINIEPLGEDKRKFTVFGGMFE